MKEKNQSVGRIAAIAVVLLILAVVCTVMFVSCNTREEPGSITANPSDAAHPSDIEQSLDATQSNTGTADNTTASATPDDSDDPTPSLPPVDPPSSTPGSDTCEHTYVVTVVAPTCISKGYTHHVCSKCDASYADAETEPTGHSMGNWTITKEASCGVEGQQTRTCSQCSHSESQTIAAKQHSYGAWKVTKAAGCVTTGTESRTCSICSKSETRSLEPVGHSYGSWKTTKAATCDATGTQQRTCSKCNKVESKDIAATGHKWDNGKMTTTPTTCSDVGIKTYTCTACSKTKTERVTGSHSYGNWQWEEYQYKAYCDPYTHYFDPYDCPGYKIYTSHRKYHVCTKCGYRETIKTEDHLCILGANDRVQTFVDKGNCQRKSVVRSTCSICGYYEDRSGDYGPHPDWTRQYIDIEKTEHTEECHMKISTCSLCGTISYSYTKEPGSFFIYPVNPKLTWCQGVSIEFPTAYDENPDPNGKNWNVVGQNYVLDKDGYLVSFDVHWHDKNKQCRIQTVVIADLKPFFESYGYEFKPNQKYTLHISINETGIHQLRMSWSG